MQTVLPEFKIGNYAFSGAGYGGRYIKAIERVLITESDKKVIILGLSARTLLKESSNRNRFMDLSRAIVKNPGKMRNPLYHKFTAFFRAYEEHEIINLFTLQRRGTYSIYHPDGWIEGSRKETEIERTEAMYSKIFQRDRVNYKTINFLTRRVAQWRKQGITVISFHPPTVESINKLETDQGRYRDKYISRRFQEAGAFWLTFDSNNYSFYDGIHMRSEYAKKYSNQIAENIAFIFKWKLNASNTFWTNPFMNL